MPAPIEKLPTKALKTLIEQGNEKALGANLIYGTNGDGETLTGTGGVDYFVFDAAASNEGEADQILGFEQGVDKLVFLNTGQVGTSNIIDLSNNIAGSTFQYSGSQSQSSSIVDVFSSGGLSASDYIIV